MSIDDIGRITPADEFLDHQIADTFATIVESDFGWTEKIWGALARRDGSLTVSFGLGKYHNRNVMDGFAGISRGKEQWTVRSSRRLDTALQLMQVGAIRYEVVEPLKQVRFALEANAQQPIAFDILFEGELPPFFEERNRLRTGNRISMDVVRYHQPGKLLGRVELDGTRHTFDDDWFGFRDHSWGMRGQSVGAPAPDLQPGLGRRTSMRMLWGPWLMQRPDGSRYEVMHFIYDTENWCYFSGHLNTAGTDGSTAHQTKLREMTPDVKLDPVTRSLCPSSFQIRLPDGTLQTAEVTPLGESGFYLRTGQYGGWNGGRHGSWASDFHEEGDYIPDMIAVAPSIGPLRDTPVKVRIGDDVGYGIQETIFLGIFPELGLDASSNHPID